MLIVGAKGFAKEVLEILHQLNELKNVCFFDDINANPPQHLYNRFRVIRKIEDVEVFFQNTTPKFTLGVGNPSLRYYLFNKFKNIGGEFSSTISPFCRIGHYGNYFEPGCNIMTGTVITNDVNIKKGCLINLNCTIGHDSVLEEFVELSPGVHISGNCNIGKFSSIGTNASVLPKITIGENVIVGAGAVVTKHIPSNSLAVGIPAKVIREIPPIEP